METMPPPLLHKTVLEPLPDATWVDELVLLHGWGTDSRIWQPLMPLLRRRCRLHLVDLPGFGCNAAINLWRDEAALLAALEPLVPVGSHLLGWSLGGNVALAFGRRFPDRVRSLTLVACNPSFVARAAHTAAMPPAVFEGFVAAVRCDAPRALGRFAQLQCKGDVRARSVAQHLRELPGPPPNDQSPALLDALGYLGVVDQRVATGAAAPACTPHYILGERDALVPEALAPQLERVTVMRGIAHLPMLSDPEGLAQLVLGELRRHPPVELHRRKQRVARSFSAAAGTYDSVAEFQRLVGERLFDYMVEASAACANGVGIDLGCGTGFSLRRLRERQPQRCWLGGDIALGMLAHIRAASATSDGRLLALDAESLPCGDGTVQLLFSNLALQWCQDLDALFSEVARVLAPGGRLVFSTLLHGTLDELRTAWAEVDAYAHVNQFYREAQWLHAVAGAELECVHWQRELRVTRYPALSDLVHELKALGAHNVDQGRLLGLTGRSHWRRLRTAYETRRRHDGQLPATWQVLYGVLERRAYPPTRQGP